MSYSGQPAFHIWFFYLRQVSSSLFGPRWMMKWRILVRVKFTALVVTDFGRHRPLMGREWIQALVILPSLSRVNQLEGKQALTLEAVLTQLCAEKSWATSRSISDYR